MRALFLYWHKERFVVTWLFSLSTTTSLYYEVCWMFELQFGGLLLPL